MVENNLDTNLSKENTKERKVIEIEPLTRGRRFLLYFCDLIICFFTTFLIFNAAVFPLSTLMTPYNDKLIENGELYNHNFDILYEHEILFYKDYKYTGFENDSLYSFTNYLKYWVLEDANDAKFDFLKNYYVDVRNDETKYKSVYINENNKFFTLENNTIKMVKEYKDEFTPVFDDKDKVSDKAAEDLKEFQNVMYAEKLGDIISDIKVNDLKISTGLTYNESLEKINENDIYFRNHYLLTTIIAYTLSWLILHIIIPQCNHNHKTISMFMLHEERINSHFFKLNKRSESLIFNLYAYLENALLLVFIPMVIVPFNIALGNLPLLTISLISLLFNIISIIIMLFDNYSRMLGDLLTYTVTISQDSLDDIYRQIGYKI